jgi:hypothetical protein
MSTISRKWLLSISALLCLVGAAVLLYFLVMGAREGEPRADAWRAAPLGSSSAAGEVEPDTDDDVLLDKDISPASEGDWLAPGMDPRSMEALLKAPPSQVDVFDSVEWTATNAWASVPDIGGPWALARRECAREKLGFAVQEPCDYFVNLVVQRGPDGAGEVVAARAEFATNSLGDDPDFHLSGEPSLASARCRNFARCLVTRGYAKAEAVPMAPGAEGELVALQIAGREVSKRDPTAGSAEAERRLNAAIEGTMQQLRMFEDNPDPADLGWHFNVASLRRALEYYRWLKTQI